MTSGFKVMLAGAGLAAMGLAVSESSAEIVRPTDSVGALRSPASELVNGLKLSLSETLRYEDNLVRTSGDAETLAEYGTDDASDFVSTTSLNAELSMKEERSVLKFIGNLGYSNYSNFDQFSGVVGGARGEWDWHFTNRCNLGVNSGLEWRLSSFDDNLTSPSVENRQLATQANVDVGCFVVNRIRASAEVFGGKVENDATIAEGNDYRYRGVQGALAYVTAQENEIGVRYRTSTTKRPNFAGLGDTDNHRWDVYTKWHLGEKLHAGASLGFEELEEDNGTTTDRASGTVDLSWFPSDRVAIGVDYLGGFVDAEDLAGVNRETDRFGASVNWKVSPRATVGAFARFEDDTLKAAPVAVVDPITNPVPPNLVYLPQVFSGTLDPVDGTKEETATVGATLRHSVFNRFEAIWSVGYADRSSDEPLRQFESAFASVTIGVSF